MRYRAHTPHTWTRNRPGHVGRVVIPQGTEWLDDGPGKCTLCGDERRLYAPLIADSADNDDDSEGADIRACAPCTQVYALSSIPNNDRSE